jgi:hypothetical protein
MRIGLICGGLTVFERSGSRKSCLGVRLVHVLAQQGGLELLTRNAIHESSKCKSDDCPFWSIMPKVTVFLW